MLCVYLEIPGESLSVYTIGQAATVRQGSSLYGISVIISVFTVPWRSRPVSDRTQRPNSHYQISFEQTRRFLQMSSSRNDSKISLLFNCPERFVTTSPITSKHPPGSSASSIVCRTKEITLDSHNEQRMIGYYKYFFRAFQIVEFCMQMAMDTELWCKRHWGICVLIKVIEGWLSLF